MKDSKIVRIDGIKWLMNSSGVPEPLCPDHNMRLKPIPNHYDNMAWPEKRALKLKCSEGPHYFDLPRKFYEEIQYVIDRIDAKIFEGMEVVDLDGELTPIIKEKISSKDDKYFVTAQLMKSKRGLQLVVYVGEKGKSEKTQIFIEPEIKRLAFDQRNLNPTEVFAELKATFSDGSNHIMNAKTTKDNE